ncbi:unnamed protein product [Adineta steineri]|uniref:Uncharacterized protein n=2 Tax=Adineta steineri TaxID=433720 RepID=A0A814I2T9_9BILA|nr:unnamed protein product [Adineta steineri]
MKTESSTITVSDITPGKFDELCSKHKKTLSCPCSTISMPHKTFVSNIIKRHPVCKSIFVNQSWIEALYLLNANRYGIWDFRTTASSQFALLSNFCSIAEDAVFHIENDVGNNDFITTYLLTDTQIQLEVNSTTESFKNSASARITMFLNYLRTTIRENYLVSALNTNLIMKICPDCFDVVRPLAFPVMYNSTNGGFVSCNQGNPTSVATLNPLLNDSVTLERIRKFESMPNSTIVSGFFAACTPLEALLQSTLDCLYEIECLHLLFGYFPALNHMGVNWTDSVLTSKQQNLSVNDYFNNLFIEEWLTKINYTQYFNECHPSVCTFTATDRADISYAITLFVSLYGSLVIILRLIASFLVTVSLKFKHRSRNASVHFGSIIVLLLFNSLSTHTDTVTIPNPSLIMYKDLQTLYSATLNCPCSTKAISYRSFVSLSPTLHQVCSSGFVNDDWFALLKRSAITDHPNDWRNRAPPQFQLLSDFCRLANKTIDDSVNRFLKQFFIASTVFNEIDLDTQLNATLRQFYNSTIFDFSLQNDVVRLLMQVDQPYMGPLDTVTDYWLSNLIITNIENERNNQSLSQVSFILPAIPESNSTVLTCVCATNPHCRALNCIYSADFLRVHGNWFDRFKMAMRNMNKLLYTTLINLNIFSLNDIGSNVDPITAKRLGRWATRLYIALFIGGLGILTIYNLIQPEMLTKTFDKPSFSVYKNLKQLHGDKLKCPCSVIASAYSQFIEIEPIFHEICSSPFASEQGRINLTAGLVSNLSIYARRDYRRFLSAHLQFLQGLCQLSKDAVYNLVNQIRTSLLVTSELLSETNFNQTLQSLIEQSKSNAPTIFRHLLFLIRTINHGNAFMSTYGTNFEYIVPKNTSSEYHTPTRALIYDDECSCGLCSNCTTQANFITFNSSGITSIPIKGLNVGCTPSESFRASTLECFFDRSCIDLIHQYTNYSNSHDLLSITNSRFSNNSTIAELIDSLFIEQWSNKTNYTSYFQQCLPSYCFYTSVQKFNLLDIITLLLSLQGGLTIILKWICPKIVRITSKLNDYRKKRRNTVRPVCVLEKTSSDISNTTINNVTTDVEIRSTPETSQTIVVRSVRCTSKVFFGCILLTCVLAALAIFSFYTVRQAPLCKLNFRSISMNTSNYDIIPHAFVSADFNNDNRLDLVFYSELYTTLNLLLGNGDGSFRAENIIPTENFNSLSHVDVGDFNNDNRSDLVLANRIYLGILFGNENGIFAALIRFELGEKCTPLDITVADFNHDNHSDIAIVSWSNNNICVFLKSNDNFSSPFIFSTGHNSQPRSLNVGDFNNDGHLDIAVTNNNAVNIGVFIGCGNGTFEIQKWSFTSMSSNPNNIAVGDFDGDTYPDIVTSNIDDNLICVLSKYNNGVFGVKQNFFIKSVWSTPSVAVGDFNCDGYLDIAVGTTNPYGIDALLGYGDGHFDTQTIFPTQLIDKNIMIAVHDFNGDTYQDIIAIDDSLNTIDILLNICECCTREILKKSNSSLQ